ncbi:Amino acid kinase family protein [Novipirellula aureliae]|uniref:Amino acid kinase family protein n=1 Tax=Novipirellula aureliae TaxID=2527966 RepID=A0A5C6ED53_9BACT|nr:hypothetical protein [Novipirellula aureliae]TWU45907.1 Amino acid kinase family protein [Novipirellula aureliae]
MPNIQRVRVIKLGGSLLSLKNLQETFHRWCRENPHPLTFVIVGGGGIVDAVREINAANPIPDKFSHWLCIDLMRHTARLAHQILGNVDLYETMHDLQQTFSSSTKDQTTPIIAVVQIGICFKPEFPNMGLPANWDVTSDTLAAAFSQMFAAEELIVMKSADVPIGFELNDLAEIGLVDPHFADLAKETKIRFVNLRTF